MLDPKEDKNISESESPKYVPSSIEKKRAVTMYVLSWIIMMIWRKDINQFELFHLKQSLWWWSCFLLVFILSLILLFVPYIKILALLLVFSMIVVLSVFIKQARDWKYHYESETKISVFRWVGWWILDLFEVDLKKAK